MTLDHPTNNASEKRAATLAALIILQAVCAVFFVIDVIEDLSEHDGGRLHLSLEMLATLSLCGGIILLMIELRQMLRRMNSMDRGSRAARGEMAELIRSSFRQWQLTPSESEVAMLVLKGFDNEAIAGLRHVSTGTVRAQTARIYHKAGVENRAQLISLFMEELLGGPDLQALPAG